MGFSLKFNGTPGELIEKIRNAVTNNNGNFSGDENLGEISIKSFLGEITGDYKIDNNLIEINISKKPFLVTEDMIKSEIMKMLDK